MPHASEEPIRPSRPHASTMPAPEPQAAPTTQIVNVYRCNILLKSKVALGYQKGELMNVVAPTPQAAAATVRAIYGADVAYLGSAVLAMDQCWTTMTGS